MTDHDSAEAEEGQATTSWRYILLGICVAILVLTGVGIAYWLLSGQ